MKNPQSMISLPTIILLALAAIGLSSVVYGRDLVGSFTAEGSDVFPFEMPQFAPPSPAWTPWADAGNRSTTGRLLVTKTWDGGGTTNNWSDGANWSGDVPPQAGDDVIFDATSTKNAVIDVNVTVRSININAGYTGTISQANNTTFTISASQFDVSTQSAGTFTCGTGATVNFNGNAYTLAGGQFNCQNGTITSAGNFILNLNGGTFNAPSGTMTFGGFAPQFNIGTGGTFNHNNGTVILNSHFMNFQFPGGAAGVLELFNLTINTGSVISLNGQVNATLRTLGTLNLVTGTFNAGTLEALGAVNIANTYGGSSELLKLTGNALRTVTLPTLNDTTRVFPAIELNAPNTTVTTSGAGPFILRRLSLAAGTFRNTLTNLEIGTGGALSFPQSGGTFECGSGTIHLNGVNLTLSGGQFNCQNGTITSAGNFILNLNGGTFNAPSGTMTFGGSAPQFNIGTGGTFNHNNGTVILNSTFFQFQIVNGAAGTLELFNLSVGFGNGNFNEGADTVRTLGDLNLNSGVISSAGTFDARGNVSIGTAFQSSPVNLRFSGANNQTYTNAGGSTPTGTWTINKTGGALTLASNLTLSQTLNIVSGEFNQGPSFDLTAAGVNLQGANATWRNYGTGDIFLAGSVSNSGGMIDIDGTTAACGEADAVQIRSTVAGTPRSWTGTGLFLVQDADVKDQAGTAAITVFGGTNTPTNGANWTFDTGCLPIKWDGGGTTNNYSEGANWLRNTVPLAVDTIVFDNTSSKFATIDQTATVGGVRINSGYTGTVSVPNGVALNVGTNGLDQPGGFLNIASGGNLVVQGNLTLSNMTQNGVMTLAGATSSNLTIPTHIDAGDLVINKSGGAGVNLINNVVADDVSLLDGTLNNGTLDARGTNVSISSNFDGGLGELLLGGTATRAVTIPAGASLPQLRVNAPNTTVNIGGAGGIVFDRPVSFQNAAAITTGAVDLTFNGSFQLATNFTQGSGAIVWNSTYSQTGGAFNGSSAPLEINGRFEVLSGSFTATSGTTTLRSTHFDPHTNGTFNHNGGTLLVAAPSALRGAGTIVLNNLTVAEHLALNSNVVRTVGTLLLQMTQAPNTGTYDAQGNVTIASSFFPTGLNFKFSGAANQTFTNAGAAPQGIWTLDKSGGTVTLASDLDISQGAPSSFVLANGTFTTGAFTVNVGGRPVVRTSGFIIGNLQRDFPSADVKTFDVGTANGYSPVTVNAFVGTSNSTLKVRAEETAHPNAPNGNGALRRFWRLTKTGTLSAVLTFNYLEVDLPPSIPESSLELKRYTGSGTLFDTVPATLDATANTITTSSPITEFSDWTLLSPLAPTSATVEVSGRVMTASGLPVYKAMLELNDLNGQIRTARSNGFGFYRFTEVPAGATYVVSVRHRGYTFLTSSRVISVNESIDDLDFIAHELSTTSDAGIVGRVMDADGQPLTEAVVEVSGGQLREPMRAVTDQMGGYELKGLKAGETYFVTVFAKGRVFRDPTLVVFLEAERREIDFTSLP
ncbi:MAG: carboxypeptidase regulatory-like domain-containing protein [Pyrinomonadaceae bacterium]